MLKLELEGGYYAFLNKVEVCISLLRHFENLALSDILCLFTKNYNL